MSDEPCRCNDRLPDAVSRVKAVLMQHLQVTVPFTML